MDEGSSFLGFIIVIARLYLCCPSSNLRTTNEIRMKFKQKQGMVQETSPKATRISKYTQIVLVVHSLHFEESD
jgi:hypothetical protein